MSTSGLYGNPAGTTTVPSNDTTSLYGASVNAQVPNSNGDLLIKGNLAVDGGNITTTATIATLFNTNATTLGIGGAATSLSLGADTGTTSINNNLIVDGTINAAGNITATGGSFGNITIGVATDNTITTTTGNLNLQSSTGILQVSPATYIEWAENSTRTNRLNFKATNGTSTGIRVSPPVATGGLATASVNTTNDFNNTSFVNISTNQAAANPLRIQTGTYTSGVLGGSGTSLAFIDGSANTYATVNPAGPTIGTDLTTKSYVDSIPNITYTIDASTTTGGANFNLRGSDASVDTIKFASGTGVTVSQTDANTITTSIGQSVATSASPTFAAVVTNKINTTSTFAFNNGSNYATVNPSGPTNSTDLITKTYFDTHSGGAPDHLQNGSYALTLNADGTVTFPSFTLTAGTGLAPGGGNGQSLLLDQITPGNYVAEWNYATTLSNGTAIPTTRYDLTINNDGTVSFPSYKFPYADGSANQVLKTNGSGILSWYSPSDLNTTYTYTASSTTGGANLTLTGSDATTNTIKLTNGGHVTATYTSATAVTLGSDATNANTASTIVARDSSGNFSAGTITANLSGNATTATTATQVANALTAGTHLSGGPFDGSSAVTLTTDATTTATASVLVARDANANTFANAVFAGFTSVAASGSTITLTAASTPVYLITGSGGQTIKLPNATTLPAGAIFSFNNNQSSGAITVNNNSSTLIASVPSGGYTTVVLLDNSTAAGSWDRHDQTPSNVSWSTNTLSYPGSYTSSTGSVTANSTTIGASAGTVSTSSGNLTLNTANGSGSSGSIVVTAGANGNISVTPNGTGLVVLGKTTLADMSRVDGQLYATKSTSWTPPSSGLTTIDGTNGLAVGSSGGGNGYSASVGVTYYSGDTTAGTNSAASLATRGAGGTNASPSAVATNQVAGTWNIDGYATSGWATTIATTGSGGGTTSISPLQVQGYAVSAFTDSAGSVTNAPMGFRVRGFAASTAMSTANRTNFIDHQYSTATYKATTFNIQAAASTTNYATFVATGATFTGTASGLFIRNDASAGQQPVVILRHARTDQTGPTDSDGTDFRLGVGGTSTNTNMARFEGVYKSSGLNEIGMAVSTDSFAANTNRIYVGTRESTKINATPAGGGTQNTILTVTDLSVASARAVAFASYTTTTRNALTPSAGWVIWNTTTVKLECYDGTTWQALF